MSKRDNPTEWLDRRVMIRSESGMCEGELEKVAGGIRLTKIFSRKLGSKKMARKQHHRVQRNRYTDKFSQLFTHPPNRRRIEARGDASGALEMGPSHVAARCGIQATMLVKTSDDISNSIARNSIRTEDWEEATGWPWGKYLLSKRGGKSRGACFSTREGTEVSAVMRPRIVKGKGGSTGWR